MDLSNFIEALMSPSWVSSLFAVLFGGLAGAIISSIYSSRLNKTQLTITIINDYLERYHHIHAECRWMIQHPADPLSVKNVNQLILIGNWAESIAVLCKNKLIDKKIIEEYGLVKTLRMLYKDTLNCPLNRKAKYESLPHFKSF